MELMNQNLQGVCSRSPGEDLTCPSGTYMGVEQGRSSQSLRDKIWYNNYRLINGRSYSGLFMAHKPFAFPKVSPSLALNRRGAAGTGARGPLGWRTGFLYPD
jgi:hypothetical protein